MLNVVLIAYCFKQLSVLGIERWRQWLRDLKDQGADLLVKGDWLAVVDSLMSSRKLIFPVPDDASSILDSVLIQSILARAICHSKMLHLRQVAHEITRTWDSNIKDYLQTHPESASDTEFMRRVAELDAFNMATRIMLLTKEGALSEAQELYENIVVLDEDEFGVAMAEQYLAVASLLLASNQIETSLTYCIRCINILSSEQIQRSISLAQAYEVAGDCLMQDNLFDLAASRYQSSVDICISISNNDLIQLYSKLSQALTQAGNLQRALKVKLSCIEHMQALKTQAPHVLGDMYLEAGQLALELGNSQQARDLLMHSLDVQNVNLKDGENHPQTLQVQKLLERCNTKQEPLFDNASQTNNQVEPVEVEEVDESPSKTEELVTTTVQDDSEEDEEVAATEDEVEQIQVSEPKEQQDDVEHATQTTEQVSILVVVPEDTDDEEEEEEAATDLTEEVQDQVVEEEVEEVQDQVVEEEVEAKHSDLFSQQVSSAWSESTEMILKLVEEEDEADKMSGRGSPDSQDSAVALDDSPSRKRNGLDLASMEHAEDSVMISTNLEKKRLNRTQSAMVSKKQVRNIRRTQSTKVKKSMLESVI